MVPDAVPFRRQWRALESEPHEPIICEATGEMYVYDVPVGTYDDAVERIKTACDECPMCTFAAIRQSGVPMFLFRFFKLKEELAAWWSSVNDEMRREESCYDYY
jgi:hypothetical protein